MPRAKLEAYLLSETHPIGKYKAAVLRRLGFDESHVTMLEQGLLAIARSEEVVGVMTTVHGSKYVIDGVLETPTGSRLPLRTVW